MDEKLAVVGLGYVGLPLAKELANVFPVVGFDTQTERIAELKAGFDRTNSVELRATNAGLKFTSNPEDLIGCSVYVIAVPTPVNSSCQPDLALLKAACETVGRRLRRGTMVVFESTVYPGCTQDFCIPLLEEHSSMTCGIDFSVSYSPERVNPGDKMRTIRSIVKVVSSTDKEGLARVQRIYESIVDAGVYPAPSIKVAEAAKIIENVQRDVNVALMNELSIIFRKLEIAMPDVLAAANTKWNFLDFRPGLVGGHCIGVDPYYLTYKAQQVGHHPQLILAGRAINEGMSQYICFQVINELSRRKKSAFGAKILILGLTFKADCNDIRNSKVIDLINQLVDGGVNVTGFDPYIDCSSKTSEVTEAVSMELVEYLPQDRFDAVIVAVDHSLFKTYERDTLDNLLVDDGFVFDLKSIYPVDWSVFQL